MSRPRVLRVVIVTFLYQVGSRALASEWTLDTLCGTGKSEPGDIVGEGLKVNLKEPFGLEIGPEGQLFVCEAGHHRIVRLDLASRKAAAVAGSGKKGFSGDGGRATEATLNEPYEIRFDGQVMYFVEMAGAVVRKVDLKTGIISTLAGTGMPGFSGDGGPAAKAQLKDPHSIALDGKGGLFIADIGNHRIRRVDLAKGTIDTPRQCDFTPPAHTKGLQGPRALHVTGTTLWIAFREGNSVWKMDLETGKLERVAGTGENGQKDGPASEATFDGPKGIVATPEGIVYVADTENNTIRSIDPRAGTVKTIAGSGPGAGGFGGDGGPALAARLNRPHGIALGISILTLEVLYIGDTENHRVRVLQRKRP